MFKMLKTEAKLAIPWLACSKTGRDSRSGTSSTKGSLTLDVAAHSPRVASSIAPILNAGLAPLAKTIENRPVLIKQGVTHGTIALGRLGLGVVVSLGAEVVSLDASPVNIVLGTGVRVSAVLAAVKPTSGLATVVIFQI
jgi:hypothetical protein